ncbi:MAG: GNAT family N-acetyltransferase [Oscillospiraceae bacterium]|nr:GNAT family N-acetyltransferase [Oscillospiraceae bacterium]
MTIRKAEPRDIPRITELLYQVHKVHSDKRPDLFKRGSKKYDENELSQIISDSERPIFVGTDESDKVLGYAFCIFQHFGDNSLEKHDTIYIDDLCVDESCRENHIGSALYSHVLKFAKDCGCYNVTLNVWAQNDSAISFYNKMGLSVQKYTMEKIL